MRRNLGPMILAGFAVVFMAGCPPISAIALVNPGHWSFERSGIGSPISIVLIDGGTTAGVPGGPPAGSLSFAGTLTWMQVDDVFTMTQVLSGGDTLVFTGMVFAETYMEGSFLQTVGGSASGIWTATFVP